MISFKDFLTEDFITEIAQLQSIGKDAHRHAQKYIQPGVKGLTLGSDNYEYPAGSEIHPVAKTTNYDPIKGYSSLFRVGHPETGAKIRLPHSHVNKPDTGKVGNAIDEKSVVRMANHAVAKHQGNPFKIEDLHNEIEKARNDPTHHLNYHHAGPEDFHSGVQNEKSEASHYQGLRDAAYTVHALAHHKDFQPHFAAGHKFVHSGNKKAEITDEYEEKRPEGSKKGGRRNSDSTYKTDISVQGPDEKHLRYLSMKQGKGAQYFSGTPAEMYGSHLSAFNSLLKKGHISTDDHARGKRLIEALHRHMQDNKNMDAARDTLKKIYSIGSTKEGEENEKITDAVKREALTGEGKFKKNADGTKSDAVPTHIITGGTESDFKSEKLKPHVERIDDYLKNHKEEIATPVIEKGNNGDGKLGIRGKVGANVANKKFRDSVTPPPTTGPFPGSSLLNARVAERPKLRQKTPAQIANHFKQKQAKEGKLIEPEPENFKAPVSASEAPAQVQVPRTIPNSRGSSIGGKGFD